MIMNVNDKLWKDVQVDHIRGEMSKNDNRKSNLRVCTPSQNCMNRRIRLDNTSGVTGVNWDKHKNKWVARIFFENKKLKKCFDDFNSACIQRKEWEDKYFNNFSYDNSQKKGVDKIA